MVHNQQLESKLFTSFIFFCQLTNWTHFNDKNKIFNLEKIPSYLFSDVL